MKIKIDINNTKSIDRAIQQLENASNQISSVMFKEFLSRCCVKISQLANENLRNIDVGVNVKSDIENSWLVTVDNNGTAILSNRAEKAVYVEFGVGIVGESEPHPNASKTGWEYNKDSIYKKADGSWIFYQNAKDLDLPSIALDDRIIFNEPDKNSERMLIKTRGAVGSWFVYNAIVEFASSGCAEQIWEEIKIKYWG